MSTPTNLRLLTRYSAWANALLYAALREAPEIELTKARQILFGNLIRTLNHVHTIDLVWQAHLEGRVHGFSTRTPDVQTAFADLHTAQASLDGWYVRHAEQLSEATGEEVINFTFIGGGKGSMSRADILLHVVNHTTYHRGHIAAMMYEIPVQPPTTDLPIFLLTSALPSGVGHSVPN